MTRSFNFGKLFAIWMILWSVAASIGYLLQRDYRRAIYWAAAAVITASVTY